MNHVIRPAAKDDILRQFRYYLLEDALDTAMRFVEAVDESIAAICMMPNAGAPKLLRNSTLEGLRFRAVKGFEDILIFYIVQADGVKIVRILHGRRDLQKVLEREKGDAPPN